MFAAAAIESTSLLSESHAQSHEVCVMYLHLGCFGAAIFVQAIQYKIQLVTVGPELHRSPKGDSHMSNP